MIPAVEWDPAKNEANIARHGIDFVAAATIFERPTLQTRSDRAGEERWQAIGRLGPLEISVAYTVRAGRYRIISARRARRNEREEYWSYVPR